MTTTPQSHTDPAGIRRAAEEIASVAGALLQELYAGPLDVRYKARQGDRDPVTAADEEVEHLVRREVAARFPGHAVLGEEAGGSGDAPVLWVVDPLDGTANFANGLPIFACSIGVLRDGAPIAAAVYTTFGPDGKPCVLSADCDGPLRLDGESWAPRPRDIRTRARLAGVPAGFRYRFRHGLLGTLPPGETRSLGSIAVELALVATGALHYAVFSRPRIWDVAGGVLLCRQAGRLVLIREGRRWRRLERFATAPDKPLREWSASAIAGDPRALRTIAPRLGVRRHPFEVAEAVLGYRRTRALMQASGRAIALAQRLRRGRTP
jgi:myo-inositol-1(or 4)-monophosphatase